MKPLLAAVSNAITIMMKHTSNYGKLIYTLMPILLKLCHGCQYICYYTLCNLEALLYISFKCKKKIIIKYFTRALVY